MKQTVVYDGDEYDARHGGAFDRGSADSYYGRPRRPHYFLGDTYTSLEVVPNETETEYWDYLVGYDYNEQLGHKKEW